MHVRTFVAQFTISHSHKYTLIDDSIFECSIHSHTHARASPRHYGGRVDLLGSAEYIILNFNTSPQMKAHLHIYYHRPLFYYIAFLSFGRAHLYNTFWGRHPGTSLHHSARSPRSLHPHSPCMPVRK